MAKTIKHLKQKSQKLETDAKFYESIIQELKATQKSSSEKSKVLRKAFHADIDKYFDTVDERIEVACGTDLKTFKGQNQAMIKQIQACVGLTSKMDNLIAKTDSELLAEGEKLLSKAEELSQSLAGPSIDAVEIPQVRVERGKDWSLEGGVDLQLLPVQRKLRVSITSCREITF